MKLLLLLSLIGLALCQPIEEKAEGGQEAIITPGADLHEPEDDAKSVDKRSYSLGHGIGGIGIGRGIGYGLGHGGLGYGYGLGGLGYGSSVHIPRTYSTYYNLGHGGYGLGGYGLGGYGLGGYGLGGYGLGGLGYGGHGLYGNRYWG